LSKLVSENTTDWDEHLSIVLFSYIITYNIIIGYTPYQLVYGLHPLIPIEYIISVVGGDERNNTPVRILISLIREFAKLQEARMQATKIIGI
jgi:hypothetical protein